MTALRPFALLFAIVLAYAVRDAAAHRARVYSVPLDVIVVPVDSCLDRAKLTFEAPDGGREVWTEAPTCLQVPAGDYQIRIVLEPRP